MQSKIAAIKGVRDLISRPPGDVSAGLRLAQISMAQGLGLGRSWLFLPDAQGNFVSGEVGAEASGIGQAADLFAAVPAPAVLSGPDKLNAVPALQEFLTLRGAGRIGLAPMVEAGKLAGLICLELPNAASRRFDLALISEFAGLMQDVLASIRQDAVREETSARLAALLQAMPDLLLEFDSAGVFTGFVSGQGNTTLVRPEDTIGKDLSEVFPADVARTARDTIARILSDGAPREFSYEVDLPSGRHSYEVRGARKEHSCPGELPTVVFVIRDVTNQQALREELLRLSSVTRAMSNLVIILDTEQRVVWINPAFERRSGWTLDEIKGQVITDLVRCEESDPEEVRKTQEAIRDVKPYSGNMVNKDRYGNRYHVDFNILPLWSASGDLQGYVSVETIVTELKEQQIALKSLARTAEAAQTQLANALNALAEGVMLFDADLKLVTCNPAQRRAFPKVADLMVPGLAMRDLLHAMVEQDYLDGPSDPAALQSRLDDLIRAYQTESFEDEKKIKDGRWFRRVNKRTSDGGLVTVMIDITALQRHMVELDSANERLSRALAEREMAEQRLSSIKDETRVGTWMLDLGSREMSAGRHWARIVGLEGPLVLQHADFLDMVHPDDRHLLESDTPNITSHSPDVFEHEFRIAHKDGHWVWVLSRGRIMRRDESGRPLVLDGVDIDISEQKRLEMEVRQSDALLKSALESNVAAVAIFDSNDILLYCNPEAERMLKLKPGLLYGRQTEGPIWTIERLNGEPLPPEEWPCNLAREAGTLLRDLRCSVRWSDGRRQVLTCSATPFQSGDGQTHTAVSFWDSTEELAATERMQEALNHAEAMSRSKSIFLANMSHEIRTPLNGVLGLAEVLSMQIKDPEHSRMIATIRRSGETLLSVLNTILDMSKIEAGKIELEKVPFRLIDVLQQVEGVYSVMAEEQGIDFDVITSAGADLTRIGDPHRIQQIIGNLLSNAIKFSSDGGVTLTVSCRPGKPVVFTVADTGIGMTADQCSRVFSSFEQADESVSRRFGGTGLGLSIVRELVELFGGTISLSSELGVGTEVQVSLPLPLVDEEIGDLALKASEPAEINGTGHNSASF